MFISLFFVFDGMIDNMISVDANQKKWSENTWIWLEPRFFSITVNICSILKNRRLSVWFTTEHEKKGQMNGSWCIGKTKNMGYGNI